MYTTTSIVHGAGIWFVSGTYSSYLFDFCVLQALVIWCECRCLLLYTVGKINSTVNDMVQHWYTVTLGQKSTYIMPHQSTT